MQMLLIKYESGMNTYGVPTWLKLKLAGPQNPSS
jgi:hypothetical protein